MRDIKVLKVYNLVNSNGTKLQLRLGMLKSRAGEVCISNADKGYRWSFIGEHIPMPVRSYYWFNGFAENIMLDWLKGNGWYPKTCVYMCNGTARVYELPNTEPSKGNEAYELLAHVITSGEETLKRIIKRMCNEGDVLKAINFYRYVHPCSLGDAKHAVDAIRLDKQQ